MRVLSYMQRLVYHDFTDERHRTPKPTRRASVPVERFATHYIATAFIAGMVT